MSYVSRCARDIFNHWDFINKITDMLLLLKVWMEAAVQACYSLGVGFGHMLMLASYNKKLCFQPHLPKKASGICFRNAFYSIAADTIMSVLCTISIFSVLGFMAKKNGKRIDEITTGGDTELSIPV